MNWYKIGQITNQAFCGKVAPLIQIIHGSKEQRDVIITWCLVSAIILTMIGQVIAIHNEKEILSTNTTDIMICHKSRDLQLF